MNVNFECYRDHKIDFIRRRIDKLYEVKTSEDLSIQLNNLIQDIKYVIDDSEQFNIFEKQFQDFAENHDKDAVTFHAGVGTMKGKNEVIFKGKVRFDSPMECSQRELFRQLCESICQEWGVKFDEIDADFVVTCQKARLRRTYTSHFGVCCE